MDIAVLSDIHSNYVALEKCIDFAVNRGVVNFLFLGDYVSDCPYPQRTMQLLYDLHEKYACWFIRGNREDYMLDYKLNGEQGWIPGSSSGCLLYTYRNLTDRDLDFFQGMPDHLKITIPGFPSFYCCHGSINSTREHLYRDSALAKYTLKNLETDILLCGHTHEQGTYAYLGRKIINPGSVGIPWYYSGKTQFAILHGTEKEWSEEYFQLDYDRDSILEAYENCGLNVVAPMWSVLAKEVIKTGKDVTIPVLTRAMDLCKKENGEVTWPYIPEKYWELAATEHGIYYW